MQVQAVLQYGSSSLDKVNQDASTQMLVTTADLVTKTEYKRHKLMRKHLAWSRSQSPNH